MPGIRSPPAGILNGEPRGIQKAIVSAESSTTRHACARQTRPRWTSRQTASVRSLPPMSEPGLSVVVTLLNEEGSVEELYRRTVTALDGRPFELIFVDDGSNDGSLELLTGLAATDPHVRVVEFRKNFGQTAAMSAGIQHATGDVIVTLDGDHSYPVDAISYLLAAFEHLDCDFLNASRFPVRDRRAMSFKHKCGNWILSLTTSVLFFRWVRDSQSGMWVFRRSILPKIRLESDGMAFSEEIKVEVIKRRDLRFEEIPVMYSSRLGEIKLNPWRDGFRNLAYLFRKRFQF